MLICVKFELEQLARLWSNHLSFCLSRQESGFAILGSLWHDGSFQGALAALTTNDMLFEHLF